MKNICKVAVSALFYLLASIFFVVAFSSQKVFASEKLLKDKQIIISKSPGGGDTIWGG